MIVVFIGDFCFHEPFSYMRMPNLPKTVTYLKLEIFVTPFYDITIPNWVKQVTLSSPVAQHKSIMIPEKLTHLKIIGNQIDVNQIPNNVKYLTLSSTVMNFEENNFVNLKSLTIIKTLGTTPCKKISLENMPDTIKYLKINSSNVMEINKFPNNLKYLSAESGIHDLSKLPRSLVVFKYKSTPYYINAVQFIGKFPNNLEYFKQDCNHAQNIELPNSLIYIDYGGLTPIKKIPKNVKIIKTSSLTLKKDKNLNLFSII
jgi:hypothetical protein